ncbi:MAG: peroxidase family protein, partial [Thermoleophilaceae bacterium]
SQVRAAYTLNESVTNLSLFVPGDDVPPRDDLRGQKSLPDGWQIEWANFLPVGAPELVQPSRLIDGHLSPPLFDIPRLPAGEHQSLALRNLLRGQALQLPSGQDVARHLRVEKIFTGTELGTELDPTPLWFYVLKESELVTGGQRLGPVGAEIVCEVLLGLLENDPQSYFRSRPDWRPSVPIADPEDGLTLGDLVRFALS